MTGTEWPREIWMAERIDHDQGVVTAVLSEHATVARFEGDKERERDFHRYVDGDIYDSQERYFNALIDGERDGRTWAEAALRDKDAAMQELFRRMDAAGVSYADLIP